MKKEPKKKLLKERLKSKINKLKKANAIQIKKGIKSRVKQQKK